jgi:acyl-CoA synthetase (AMP-forming)/AMP-acid ligase II
MSEPKGVMLSHGNLLSNARAKLAAAPQFATDVRLNVLPFAHAYARTCELSTWIISGSLLCIARDWAEFLELSPIGRACSDLPHATPSVKGDRGIMILFRPQEQRAIEPPGFPWQLDHFRLTDRHCR